MSDVTVTIFCNTDTEEYTVSDSRNEFDALSTFDETEAADEAEVMRQELTSQGFTVTVVRQ